VSTIPLGRLSAQEIEQIIDTMDEDAALHFTTERGTKATIAHRERLERAFQDLHTLRTERDRLKAENAELKSDIQKRLRSIEAANRLLLRATGMGEQ
jgi:hypothetical protein